MSDLTESIFTISFQNIHKIITRALQVSIERIQGLATQEFEDEGSKQGFLNYVQTLVTILHSHHLTEDDLVFPYLRAKLPHAPFETLVQEHHAMVRVLDEIKPLLKKGEVAQLLSPLKRLNALWHPHIDTEMCECIHKADGVVSGEEQARMVKRFSEHGQGHSGPPELALPFLLYNLSPEDRQEFSKDWPPELLQHLVPVVWKAKWESMAPYLWI